VLSALQGLGRAARFSSSHATMQNIKLAFAEASVVFISAHADENSNIAIENAMAGQGVLMSPESFVAEIESQSSENCPLLVVLAVCHSQKLAEALVTSNCARYVISCKQDQEVKSDVVRAMYNSILVNLSQGKDMSTVYSNLLEEMSSLATIELERRPRQRQKFFFAAAETLASCSKDPLESKERNAITNEPGLVLTERGAIIDLSPRSSPMHFAQRTPLPLFGRAGMVQNVGIPFARFFFVCVCVCVCPWRG